MAWEPSRFLCPWDSPGKNTAVVCHALLQEIFPTLRSNPHFWCLLHWQADSLPQSHLGSGPIHTARGKARRLNGDQSRTHGAGLDDSSGRTPRGLKEEEGPPRRLFLSGERPPTPSHVPSGMVRYMCMPAGHTHGENNPVKPSITGKSSSKSPLLTLGESRHMSLAKAEQETRSADPLCPPTHCTQT